MKDLAIKIINILDYVDALTHALRKITETSIVLIDQADAMSKTIRKISD